MVGALVITLREGLEAALIVSVILAYLSRTGRSREGRAVWIGVALAVLASALAGYAVFAAVGSLEGQAKQVFEGTALFAAVGVLTYTIVWMRRHSRGLSADLGRRVEKASSSGTSTTLIALAFLVVVREGLETALFLLGASQLADGVEVALGGAAGLAVAIGIGVLLYRGALRLDVGRFFVTTGVLLVVFAAGMVGYGVHEFIEAGVLPAVIDPVWNINPVLDDKAGLGLLLKALLGYNGNPALTEVIAYVAYLCAMLLPMLGVRRSPQPRTAEATA
jgi:high-affinity iron transporter